MGGTGSNGEDERLLPIYYGIIVAATALERGSDVATFSRKHFDLVNGLTVVEPV